MKAKIFLIGLVGLALSACSHVDEADRIIKLTKKDFRAADDVFDQRGNVIAVARQVLLEDFTGQKCVNCPRATETIEELHEIYGDHLVPVSIHGGDFGFHGTATNIGLATDTGDAYCEHWKVTYQPVGTINRHGLENFEQWSAVMEDEAAKTTPLRMAAEATLSGDNISITVTTDCLDGTYSGKLQVWVLEDGIVAMQSQPDGSVNREYVHNHVLRAAVNGTWGDDYTASKGDSRSHSFTQAVPSGWNRQKLSVVAFVYNDTGVEQVVKTTVK